MYTNEHKMLKMKLKLAILIPVLIFIFLLDGCVPIMYKRAVEMQSALHQENKNKLNTQRHNNRYMYIVVYRYIKGH